MYCPEVYNIHVCVIILRHHLKKKDKLVWFKSLSTQALLLLKKYMISSLLQGKHLPFSPSPLRPNIFRLFVFLSLTQLYRYTPEIYLFSTAIFKYTYRAPLRRIRQEYSANVAFSTFQSLKRIQPLRFALDFSYAFGIL